MNKIPVSANNGWLIDDKIAVVMEDDDFSLLTTHSTALNNLLALEKEGYLLRIFYRLAEKWYTITLFDNSFNFNKKKVLEGLKTMPLNSLIT